MRAQNPNGMTIGLHYWDGAVIPSVGEGWWGMETFSVGIFKAVLTAKGDRCKRGPVLYRVRGPVSKADDVFDRATEICRLMDRDKWVVTKKSEVVGYE